MQKESVENTKTRDKTPRARSKARLWLLVTADENDVDGDIDCEKKNGQLIDFAPTLAKLLPRTTSTEDSERYIDAEGRQWDSDCIASSQPSLNIKDSERMKSNSRRVNNRRSCNGQPELKCCKSDCLVVPLNSLCLNQVSDMTRSPCMDVGSPEEAKHVPSSFCVSTPFGAVPATDVSCNISVIETAQPSPESLGASKALELLNSKIFSCPLERPSSFLEGVLLPFPLVLDDTHRLRAIRMLQRAFRGCIARRRMKIRKERCLKSSHYVRRPYEFLPRSVELPTHDVSLPVRSQDLRNRIPACSFSIDFCDRAGLFD